MASDEIGFSKIGKDKGEDLSLVGVLDVSAFGFIDSEIGVIEDSYEFSVLDLFD